ncbi:MAG: hypothetical protein DRJ59_07135 [Thermoprotei archaeon]|nr:MAG: hypothetical protein DRJ59_07135 [Thermoprotei archaeon]
MEPKRNYLSPEINSSYLERRVIKPSFLTYNNYVKSLKSLLFLILSFLRPLPPLYLILQAVKPINDTFSNPC